MLAGTDADLYKQALAYVGKEGEAELKARIVQRSKESTMSLMSKAGASDHARVKAMSLVHDELTAYVRVVHAAWYLNAPNTAFIPIELTLPRDPWNCSVRDYRVCIPSLCQSLVKIPYLWAQLPCGEPRARAAF